MEWDFRLRKQCQEWHIGAWLSQGVTCRSAEGALGRTVGADKEGLECHATVFSLYLSYQWFSAFSTGEISFANRILFVVSMCKMANSKAPWMKQNGLP